MLDPTDNATRNCAAWVSIFCAPRCCRCPLLSGNAAFFCMINLSSPYVSSRERTSDGRRAGRSYGAAASSRLTSSSTYLLRPLFQSRVTNNVGMYISVFNRVRHKSGITAIFATNITRRTKTGAFAPTGYKFANYSKCSITRNRHRRVPDAPIAYNSRNDIRPLSWPLIFFSVKTILLSRAVLLFFPSCFFFLLSCVESAQFIPHTPRSRV